MSPVSSKLQYCHSVFAISVTSGLVTLNCQRLVTSYVHFFHSTYLSIIRILLLNNQTQFNSWSGQQTIDQYLHFHCPIFASLRKSYGHWISNYFNSSTLAIKQTDYNFNVALQTERQRTNKNFNTLKRLVFLFFLAIAAR